MRVCDVYYLDNYMQFVENLTKQSPKQGYPTGYRLNQFPRAWNHGLGDEFGDAFAPGGAVGCKSRRKVSVTSERNR
jgi:hypothetical protein